MDLPNLKRETIYGIPAVDQVMFNRNYVVGYFFHLCLEKRRQK